MQEIGKLTVIQGTMYGGKTEEMYNIADTLNTHVRKKIQIYIPQVNNERDGKNMITSHRGTKFRAKSIISPEEILIYVKSDTHAVFIDEGQFFQALPLRKTVLKLLRKGYDVYICGLMTDFSGNPFDSMAKIQPYASKILKKNAHCTFFINDDTLCGEEAFFNQRLDFESNPITSGEQIAVDSGMKFKYETRCFLHFVWPDEITDKDDFPQRINVIADKLVRVM